MRKQSKLLGRMLRSLQITLRSVRRRLLRLSKKRLRKFLVNRLTTQSNLKPFPKIAMKSSQRSPKKKTKRQTPNSKPTVSFQPPSSKSTNKNSQMQQKRTQKSLKGFLLIVQKNFPRIFQSALNASASSKLKTTKESKIQKASTN